MIKITSMQHIGVFMADPVKAADWYGKNMGFKIVGDFTTASGHRAIFVHSDAVGITYELVGQPKGSPEYHSFLTGPADIAHVAYEVEDIETAFAQAKRDGLDILEGIIDIPEFWKNGFRYFMTRAATGECVEFCKLL